MRPDVINTNSIYVTNPYSNGTGIQFLAPSNTAGFQLGPVGPLFAGTGAARTLVLPAGIGSLGRNTVRPPGEFDLDMAVGREFPIHERLRLLYAPRASICSTTRICAPNTSLTVTTNAAGQPIFSSPGWLDYGERAARFMQLVRHLVEVRTRKDVRE